MTETGSGTLTADWFNQTVSTIKDWHAREFGASTLEHVTLEHVTLVVVEEAGEVARAVGKHVTGVRRGTDWEGKIREECADVVIAAVGLSRVAGFSLREAIAERVLTVTARVNGTPEEDAR